MFNIFLYFFLYIFVFYLIEIFWWSYDASSLHCVVFGASVKTRLLLFALKNFELQYLEFVLIRQLGLAERGRS